MVSGRGRLSGQMHGPGRLLDAKNKVIRAGALHLVGDQPAKSTVDWINQHRRVKVSSVRFDSETPAHRVSLSKLCGSAPTNPKNFAQSEKKVLITKD